MSLNSRAVIVNDEAKIEVKIKLKPNTKYNLIADGQVVSEFTNREFLTFKRSLDDCRLIHSDTWNFFEVLHQKLHWNAEI
jgi:NAD kinase